jgi:GntR family transcriptional regulator/MocR family aminotransferase
MRAAWLVVPPALVDTFAAALRITGHGVGADVQAALADFLAEGHFAAHVRRMRGLYADRQTRLVRALRRRLEGELQVEPRDGGMQLPAFLPEGVDDVAASRAAEAEGVTASPLSAYRLQPSSRGGFYLGYAGVPEREIAAGVERLARALARGRARRGGGVVRSTMLGTPPR